MTDSASGGELLLLDTHVWIWAALGEDAKVERRIPGLITAAAQAGRVRLSAVSLWEAGGAMSRGRVPIRGTVDDWMREAIAAFGGVVRPVDRATALASLALPGLEHGDPGDRLLIATARLMGARLATADRHILAYGAQGHVDVLDVRP